LGTALYVHGKGLRNILGAFLILFILLGMAIAAETANPPINTQTFVSSQATTHQGTYFDYVVIIIMENHSLCSVVGNITIGCKASAIAPYETMLAQYYTLATRYTAITHPSLPNYIALVSGSTFGVTKNCSPVNNTCSSTMSCCPVSAANLTIVDRLEQAGLTWKAYAEDYPIQSGCTTKTNQLPFNYFQSINNSMTRCARLVKANSVGAGTNLGNPNLFLNDLGSTATASNFMWLTPTSCDQWHHLCSAGPSQGDNYLSSVVPRILNSAVFTTQRAALFIVYDEGTNTSPGSGTCPIGSGDCVYSMWAGPQVKRGYMCGASYSHYSFLSTLEWNWGLNNLTSNDGSARPMSELFTNGPPCELQTGFTNNPTNLIAGQTTRLSALVSGGVQPYSYTWNFGDGGSGGGQTIIHSYQKAGSYTTTLTVTDAAGTATTASRTLTIAPAPPSSSQPPPPNGICLQCLIQGNSTALLLIGIPVGLTIAIVFATFVKRRHRKPIPSLAG
jgi:chitodextrinase